VSAPPLAERRGTHQPRPASGARRRRALPQLQLLALVTVAAVLLRPVLAPALTSRAFQNAATVFTAVVVQALPFLALGVSVSGLIAAFVSPAALARVLPRNPALAVPVAGLAGAALPGCECGSVPIASRLMERGVHPSAAIAFLLSAPAINPVVLVATAVAFPAAPRMVLARGVASLAVSVVTGLLWLRLGKATWLSRARAPRPPSATRLATFTDTALHDFLQAGGFLVIGGSTAAALQTLVPRRLLDTVAGSGLSAVIVLASLAVVLAICSEADAFVAASLTSFSLTSRLVFLVVGPAVDVKLVALQAGTFGRAFTARFAPLVFLVAVACACLTGWVLL